MREKKRKEFDNCKGNFFFLLKKENMKHERAKVRI